MTTGSYGDYHTPSSGWVGQRSYKAWEGEDGKYESYSWGLRPKWNQYDLSHKVLRCDQLYQMAFRCPYGHGFGYAVNNYIYNDILFNTWSSAEVNKALARIVDKYRGHSFNAAVSLSQVGEFATQVVNNLRSLTRAFVLVKHGHFAAAARELRAELNPDVLERQLKTKDVGGRWLELQYGWLPTLSDTFEAAKAFERISNGPVKSRFNARLFTAKTTAVDAGMGAIGNWECMDEFSRSYSYECVNEADPVRTLGLYDPLSVAWEVLPYSFVVDWFAPIGTYLSNLNQLPTMTGRWMVTDCAVRKSVRFALKAPSGQWGQCNHGHNLTTVAWYPDHRCTQEHVYRAVTNSPPSVPLPNFKFEGAIHGKRVGNAIALAQNVFSGGSFRGRNF